MTDASYNGQRPARLWLTRTIPGMEAFDDWATIDSAPKDGTKFMGGNQFTGNVYSTWYEPRWGNSIDVAEGDLLKAVVWWCLDDREPDLVTSFSPTHWRPANKES